jgi:hypothetical protein
MILVFDEVLNQLSMHCPGIEIFHLDLTYFDVIDFDASVRC